MPLSEQNRKLVERVLPDLPDMLKVMGYPELLNRLLDAARSEPRQAQGERRRLDPTDLFEALEAGLCEGTPTLALQAGHIWIDGETSFDARAVIAALLNSAPPQQGEA